MKEDWLSEVNQPVHVFFLSQVAKEHSCAAADGGWMIFAKGYKGERNRLCQKREDAAPEM